MKTGVCSLFTALGVSLLADAFSASALAAEPGQIPCRPMDPWTPMISSTNPYGARFTYPAYSNGYRPWGPTGCTFGEFKTQPKSIVKLMTHIEGFSDYFWEGMFREYAEKQVRVVVNHDIYSAHSNGLFESGILPYNICFDRGDNRYVNFHPTSIKTINLVTGSETGYVLSQEKTDQHMVKFPPPLRELLNRVGYMNVVNNPKSVYYTIRAQWFVDNGLARICTPGEIAAAGAY